MDWLAWIFLESLPALAALLFTANFILLVYWRRTGRPRPLLVGLAASAALLAVQTVVVTRREHALRILAGIQQDVMTTRTTNLADALAPNFQAGHMDRNEFLDFVTRCYDRVDVAAVRRVSLTFLDSQPEHFTIKVAYMADVRASFGGGWWRSTWEIAFQQTPQGWRINGITPIHIDGIPNVTWQRLGRP
jgi:hypothetical protein